MDTIAGYYAWIELIAVYLTPRQKSGGFTNSIKGSTLCGQCHIFYEASHSVTLLL